MVRTALGEAAGQQHGESPPVRWYRYRLSSLIWFSLGVALLMATIVQELRLRTADLRRRAVERQIEELRIAIPQSIKSGWLMQLSIGPGKLFRGSLPAGDWRLAVYYWLGDSTARDVARSGPPKGLAPLVAKRVLFPDEHVEIEILEAKLPEGMSREGTPVNTALDISMNFRRCARWVEGGKEPDVWCIPLQPLALFLDRGRDIAENNALNDPTNDQVLVYEPPQSYKGPSLLVVVERIRTNTLKPQIGTDELVELRQ